MFNVENLAGKLPDCSFINYVSSFDFVCLTETFADATSDFNGLFTEHVKFVAPAKRLSRQGRNSGGVLLLIKRAVCKFVKQIQINCANTVAVRIDKSVFNADKDVLLTSSYVAPEHSPFYDSMDLKDGIVILEENLIQEIRGEDLYILLCGDLNARTGCEQPKLDDMSNYRPGFEDEDVRGHWADRSLKDTVVNSFGKSLLNLCFLLDCVILNGCCNGDRKGEYTYVSPHGSSAIDYCI